MTRVIVKTVPEKAIIPAHEYIRIKSAEDSFVEISAVSAENNTTVSVPNAIFEEPFDIALEYSFLKPLKKREIELSFSVDENRCIITCINSRWEVPMMNPMDMPVFKYEWEPLLELNSMELKEALESISPFALNEYTASISNVHFKNSSGMLSLGASNRFSCGSYTFNTGELKRDVSFMISTATCDLVTNIADEGMTHIYTGGDRTLMFTSSWGSVSCIGHTFDNNPVNNYHLLSKKYIDREHDTITIVDKAYFKEQIRKAMAFSPVDKRILVVDILDDKLHMQVEDNFIGRKSEQEVDIILERSGSADKFVVSYEHLLRVIANTPSLGFDLEIPPTNGEGMATIKEPLVVQDEGFVFLIMPLMT